MIETGGQLLRVLIIEDLEEDAELVAHELRRAGYEIEFDQVDSMEGLCAALAERDWDVVLCDYGLPGFGASEALEVFRNWGRDIPFVILSGTIEQERVVELLRAGARDCVLKSNMHRLPPVIARELADAETRRGHGAAEQALAASEERFRQLAANIPDTIVRLRVPPELSFDYVSPAAYTMLGYTPEELYAQPELVFQIVHPDDRSLLEKVLTAPDREVFTMRVIRKDGRMIWVEQRAAGVYDESGELVAIDAVSRDISERFLALEEQERLEEQLRQSQKMEAIGSLAGGIAHDFNNLLMVIRGYNAIVIKRNTDQGLTAGLQQIDNAANRATELTRQLLAFSRQQILRPETTDLNEVVEDTLKLLERLIGTDIEIVTDLEPALLPVVVDRGQLGQVILNLAVNAREAMPDGGNLMIRTKNVELDGPYSSEHVDVTPGSYALLQLTDSGVGMDETTRSRVFDPFFTTKPEGTGLGLATVYGIVKQSGGHIFLYSEPGLGTTFKIYFPHEQGAPARKMSPRENPTPLGGGETILLVEDDHAVRTLVIELLEMYGYTVLPAANGAEAIEIAEQRRGSIDLLLTDIVMPGMNGRELADTLLSKHPTLKVLFTSGYPAGATVRHGLTELHVAFIEKPYLPDDLARIVRSVLDAPTS